MNWQEILFETTPVTLYTLYLVSGNSASVYFVQ